MSVFIRSFMTFGFVALTAGATASGATFAPSAKTGADPVAVLRLSDQASQLRIDPRGRFLAFHSGAIDSRRSVELKVLDLKTSAITPVARTAPGPVFSWATDGFRLIYSESQKMRQLPRVAQLAGKPESAGSIPAESPFSTTQVSAFDAALGKSRKIVNIPSAAGFPTMDPRALGAYLLTPGGLTTVELAFPDDRLARWQIASKKAAKGRYVATSGGMTWFRGDGDSMKRLDDDGSPLESFAVSPDGSAVVWATTDGFVYRSVEGSAAELIDRGRDPSWHPERSEILYSGAVMSGNRIAGYDLKVHGVRGKKFLTRTPYSDERWPQWQSGSGRIFYTVDRTTDIFLLEPKQIGG